MGKGRKPPAPPQRVVGIGASAGGLDAIKVLLSQLPADSGLAFVVLQHLPPSQTGQLAALLANATALPVVNVTTGQRIAANTVYVVPTRTSAAIHRGALILRTAKAGSRPRLPIDDLFRSLAVALGAQAVGVVLSGTAQDGTEGLRAIQAAGGVTFAQEPATAEFDAMPRSAIAARVTELVLAPAQIGEQLGALHELPARASETAGDAAPALTRVLEQLREACGIDFTSYKRTTIERRLARRVSKHRLGSLEEYSAYLAEHPAETDAVYEDLLIHVTAFFRDPQILDRLIAAFVETLTGKPDDVPLRIWVPGCSTGEEVYSLAMLLLEKLGDRRPLQLFGTDLSEKSVEVARLGRYPTSIASHVSAARLDRFFRRDEGGYRINQDVRERCVFARHDLVTDPPFSKLDLVSCRNLLIYLGAPLQQRVIPIMHYALNQPGLLLLGRAESVGDFDALFTTVDSEARIYARKPGARATLTFPAAGQLGRLPWQQAAILRSALDVQRDVDNVLLARYAPPCVLVDENFDVLQFRGHTGPYLEPPPGQPQLNLLRMARDGLATELPLALRRAQRADATVRKENVVVRDHRRDHQFHLEVVPVRGASDAKRYFLVVFEAVPPVATPARRTKATVIAKPSTEVSRLRQELSATKEYLRSVVTQHLLTSEELGVTNEELQSTNEELQSSNEEIQTAKEELQSTNEELETVNEELHGGNAQLREVNDDLINVLSSIEIAMIIVDTDRRVRRFTPRARTVINLIPGDLGRPIGDLQPNIVAPRLDAAIEEVIESLAMHESEVMHVDGVTSYRMQIRPYRTVDRKIVEDLLDIATSRSADLAVVVEQADPAVIVSAAIEGAREAAHAKSITLQTDLVSGARIPVDSRRLEQISTKLIGNAIKFTPSGGTVSISLALASGEMELNVRDTGEGVASERLGNVFEPFSRPDGSSTRAHPGLGVGLALVRHLVERHGGSIAVASPGVGRGTSVTVRLPDGTAS